MSARPILLLERETFTPAGSDPRDHYGGYNLTRSPEGGFLDVA